MHELVTVPRAALEALEAFRFPPKLDKRLQELMDRNNEGQLSAAEREQLEGLVELSEDIELQRSGADSVEAKCLLTATSVSIFSRLCLPSPRC